MSTKDVLTIENSEGGKEWPAGVIASVLCALFAVFCSLISVMGWILHFPWADEWDRHYLAIRPLTALGYCALGSGIMALVFGRHCIACGCWIVTAFIALLSIVQAVIGGAPLFGLFGSLAVDEATSLPLENPTALFVLLTLSAFASCRAALIRNENKAVFASTAIAFAVISIPLALLSSHKAGEQGLFANSIPGSLSALAIAAALIIWNFRLTLIAGQAEPDPSWRMARVLLPVMLLLPGLPSLIELVLENRSLLSPASRELTVVIGNVLIIAAFSIWALRRVGTDHERMADLNQTLDYASIVTVDQEGIIRHWPKGCEQFYGWSGAEAVGKNKYELLQSRCQSHWSSGLPHRPPSDTQELVEVRKDGTEVSVVEHLNQFSGRNGDLRRVLTVIDVSPTAEAVRALQVSEERLAAATAAHQLGVVDFNVTTGMFEWSPGAESRLGLKPGSVRDFESWLTMVDPEDAARFIETLRHVMDEQAEYFNYRYRFLPPDGSPRSIEGSARAYYDSDGMLVRIVGVILDVTLRAESEEALRASEAQLRSIFDTVPDPMVVLDAKGKIERFSSAAEKLWGYTTRDVIGKHVSLLIPSATWDEAEEASGEPYLLRRANNFVDRAITLTAKASSGRLIPVEARTSAARVGGQTLFTVFYRDLSEQLANKERMSDLNAELAHVSRQSAMSELAADLAHELNQPLSAAANFLAAARMLIDSDGETERVSDLLRMGAEQTQRAGLIIRRLREFLAKGEVEMRAEALEPALREAAELVLLGTGQFDIQVTYDLDPVARLVFADRIQIQQVVVNLLRNSMEALRTSRNTSRQIEITSRKLDDDHVEISVSDNGPGIPDALLTQLYARFTSTKDGSGMGIGLSISKRIIEAHGGTLSAENKAEGGAKFSFTLPTVGEVEEV